MPFDPESLKDISTDPVDPEVLGTWGTSWEPPPDYPPPVAPGKYNLVVSHIERMRTFKTKAGQNHLEFVVHLEVKGGDFDGRSAARFVKLNTFLNRGTGQSKLGDLLNSAQYPPPRSLQEYASNVQDMLDNPDVRIARGEIDWNGVCNMCRDNALKELTEQSSVEAANTHLNTQIDEGNEDEVEEAWGIKNKAKDVRLKLRSARLFPEENGTRIADATCPDCESTLTVFPVLRRSLARD